MYLTTTRLAMFQMIPEWTFKMFDVSAAWSSTFLMNLGFQTQILFILFQWCMNSIIPDHTPYGVFQSIPYNASKSYTDVAVENMFGSFVHWDATYFLHIAQYGYTFENTIAFFPLFPKLTYFMALIIDLLTSSKLSAQSCFILSAMLINTVCFSLSVVVIYKLAVIVSNKDFKFAALVTLMFTLNPARVFFIAPYSESLYCLTSFLGMLALYDTWNFKSCFFFALSAATRSNGILNAGFIVHKALSLTYNTCILKKKKKRSIAYLRLIWNLLCMLFTCGCIVSPFYFYQTAVRALFCNPLYSNITLSYVTSHAEQFSYILPGNSQASYCHSYELPYSYVQRHYWNVGLFKYYSIKQIPNFLLASPMLLLVFYASYRYFIESNKIMLMVTGQVFKVNHYNPGKQDNQDYLFSYYLHAYSLSVFCLLCIHVQVSTRMLASSTPLVYFIAADLMSKTNKSRVYCCLYFVSYCLVGIVAFTNNYPWT